MTPTCTITTANLVHPPPPAAANARRRGATGVEPMTYRPRDPQARADFEALVAQHGEPVRRPPSGYKYDGGPCAFRETAYGVMYFCLWCGVRELGYGPKSHSATCPTVRGTP